MYGDGAVSHVHDSVGGEDNAFTSEDVTGYHEVLPASRLESVGTVDMSGPEPLYDLRVDAPEGVALLCEDRLFDAKPWRQFIRAPGAEAAGAAGGRAGAGAAGAAAGAAADHASDGRPHR